MAAAQPTALQAWGLGAALLSKATELLLTAPQSRLWRERAPGPYVVEEARVLAEAPECQKGGVFVSPNCR